MIAEIFELSKISIYSPAVFQYEIPVAASKVEKKSPFHRKPSFYIKAGVSLLLLSVIYASVSWTPLLSRLESVSFPGVLTLILLYCLGQFLSALKWSVFISSVGLNRPFSSVVRAYFFGMFVNVFGFGTLGGDLARSLAIRPGPGERAPAVATVIADRIHGLCVLLAIGVGSLIILRPAGLEPLYPTLVAGGSIGLIALSTGWWLGPALLERFLPKDKKWASLILRLVSAFPRERGKIIKASLISFVFHNIQLAMHLVMARELLAPLTTSEIYAAVPFVNIGSSVPISIMGVGVREGLYAVLFSPLGVPTEISVAFGALWVLVTTLVSAFGAVAITPEMRREVELEADSPAESTISLDGNCPSM